MKKFLKNNWGRIILFIILSVVCILSFSKGKYLLGNDNYSPELNPGLTIERAIESPAWRSYRVLGFGSESEQADVFRAGFYWVAEKILPQDSLGQVFGLICLFIGSWFMGELTGLIVKDFVKKKNYQLGILLGGVGYITTLWTAWVYSYHMSPFVSQFGFIPLVLFSIYNYLREPSNKKLILIFISGLIFASSCVIATIFFVDLLLVTLFAVYFAIVFGEGKFKSKIKNIFKVLGVFIITQLFWLLPFIVYTVNNSQGLFDSYINRSITANTIDLEQEMMTAENSARFYTRLLNTTADNQGTMFFPLSGNYTTYDFYKVFSYMPVFFSVIGLIFIISKKKWKLLIFWVLAFISWFMIKNGNPPLGGIYTWLQNNMYIFKQVFRWVSSKVGNVYLVSLTITSSLGIIFFLNFLSSFFKKNISRCIIFGLFIFTLLGLQLFYSEFLFTGNLYPERSLIENIPDEYFELEEYIEENNIEDKRIYYAPPSNNGYFREYDWGFVGSIFLNYIIPNPLVDLSLAIGSEYGESTIYELEDAFLAGDVDTLKQYLDTYDISYILVDRNLTDSVYGYNMDWNTCNEIISNFNLKWESGDLELYSINDGDTINTVNISDFRMSNPLKINNYIKGIFSDDLVYDENMDQGNLPSFVKEVNSKIKIYPAVPDLEGEEISLKYKEFEGTDDEYIVVNGFVLKSTDINEGIGISTKFDDVKKIYVVNNEDFAKEDLTEEYRKSNAGDCSTGEFVESVISKSEDVASGFKLSGTDGLPCTSQKLSVEEESVVKISLDWETDGDSIAGICVYSYSEQRCINQDKYLYTEDLIGNTEIILERTIIPDEYVDIYLYSLGSAEEDSEIIFRNVSVYTAPVREELSLENSGYFIYSPTTSGIPVIKGLGYEYSGEDFTWQSVITEDASLELKNSSGMVQTVTNGTVKQYNGILTTNPYEEYIWYIEGENISNIPSSLCLYYSGDDKCWEPEVLIDGNKTYILRTFTSSKELSNLELSYSSTSYSQQTQNVLSNIVVQEIPEEWFSVLRKEDIEDGIVEADSLLPSPSYILYRADIENDEDTLTISQAQDPSWLAVGKKGNVYKIIDSKYKTVVNGWKQAWDISNLDYNTIYVIYWPNLLGYLGYILILIEGIVLTVKLFKKEKNE